MQHAYMESSNPRMAGLCACNRPECEHPQPTTRLRDLEDERELTYEAARGAVDPAPLIEFAETRAGGSLSGEYVPTANLVTLTRDRVRETQEELADARNHIVWWLQASPGHPKAQDVFLALRHITYAYDLLIREADE